MTEKLEQLEGLKHKLAVTVLAEDLKKAYQQRVTDFSKRANLKGFRPGKVPPTVVEQKFGHGLLHEAAVALIQSTFDAQVKTHGLKVAGTPHIDFDHEKLQKDQSFDYAAIFEVFPDVTLKGLSGVSIESLCGVVTDEDVSATLIKMRTHHAEWQDVDRAAKKGDRIQIDFEGMLNDQPLERGNAKGAWLELGSNSMVLGFEDGLIGVKKGEERVLSIAFPEDYHVAELRAKPVAFTVMTHLVQEPKLPALDNAFAEKMGIKEGGLDALKKMVKERMQAELDVAAKAVLKQSVLDRLMAANPILVPQALLDAEIANLQEMTRRQIQMYRQDLSKSDIKNMSLSKEPYIEEAKKRVTLGLLLAEVIKENNMQIAADKVDAKLKEVAAAYPNPEQVISAFRQNRQLLSEIEASVLEEQAIDHLLTDATLVEVKKSYDAIMNAAKASAE